MFCPECGATIPDSAKHCPQCGSAINDHVRSAATWVPGSEPNDESPASTYVASPAQDFVETPTQVATPSPAKADPAAAASAQPGKPSKLAIVGVVLLAVSAFACFGGLVGNETSAIWGADALEGANLYRVLGYYTPAAIGVICAIIGYKSVPHKKMAIASGILLALVVVLSIVGISRGGAAVSDSSYETDSQSQTDYSDDATDDSDAASTDASTDGSDAASTDATATTSTLKNFSNVEGTGDSSSEYTFNGQINLELGETFEGEGFSFYFDSYDLREEILPSSAAGEYTYYTDDPDSEYLVIEGYVTNKSSGLIGLGEDPNSTAVTLDTNGPIAFYDHTAGSYTSGLILCELADGSNFGQLTLEPGSTGKFYIALALPTESVEDSFSDSKLFFTVGENFVEGNFHTYEDEDSIFASTNSDGYLRADSVFGDYYVFCLAL